VVGPILLELENDLLKGEHGKRTDAGKPAF